MSGTLVLSNRRQNAHGVTIVKGRTLGDANAEIEEGYKSVLLCHLGNISYRLGRTVRLDPATRRIADDSEAAGRWGRQYRPGWEPQV